jgi:CheY-like chemotaxis protein
MVPSPVVAVVNSTDDIVDMLRMALEHAGLTVVSAITRDIREGHVDVERFVKQHDPRVILYDIAPPYDANWNLFQHVAQMPVMEGRQFIVTTTNARELERLAGTQQQIYEIVGKPFDLGQIVQATREAVKARPTR